jgi:DNA polymerase-3 subunit beta
MKFTVASSELQKALNKISGVVPSKSTLPILENILFDLSKNTLRLAATDLEVSMIASLEVRGTEDGKIAVPAKRIMETVRALPDVQLVFSADLSANKIKMITETGEYALVGESSEEFPSLPQLKGDERIVLESGLLRRMIMQTIFSVSVDELRPAMTGVLLQMSAKEIRAVATDGHRLVRVTYANTTQSKTKKEIIVPAKALNLVSKSLESADATLTTDASHVQFHLGNTTLTSRLIEENYPNYESVIPLDNEKTLTVSKDLLLASVRRVALYSNMTTRQIRFSLKKNEMKIAAEDIDFGGEAKEKVACDYHDDELEIGFNSTYMVDMLSHVESDEVVFKLSSPVRAAILAPGKQRDKEEVLMLVMPMRLNA